MLYLLVYMFIGQPQRESDGGFFFVTKSENKKILRERYPLRPLNRRAPVWCVYYRYEYIVITIRYIQ